MRAAVPTLPPSPPLPRRELGLLALGSALLAVVMSWPLVLHLGTDVPKDLGDPLSQAWQLAWGGHALVEQPGSFWQSNQFWPARDTLALSDALVGWAPLAVPGDGVTAAIARYDVVFLLANATACAGTYLLARELGLPPLAAALAGAAFAYSPWRLEQGGHLHILSSGGIPLSLALLLRGYRRGRPRLVLGGWAVVAWQVSIGFSLGLPYLVLLGAAATGAGIVWWRRGRPTGVPAGLVRATAGGLAVLAAVTVLLALPYLRVRAVEPQSQRSPDTVAAFSVGPKVFAISSSLNPVWGPASAGARRDLPAVAEQTLFPGLVVLLLAFAGASWRAWPRRLRRGLVASTLALAVLSLGFETTGPGRVLPYRALYEIVPGWSSIRVPQRLHTFTTLGLALLAAAGAARLGAGLAARAGWSAAGEWRVRPQMAGEIDAHRPTAAVPPTHVSPSRRPRAVRHRAPAALGALVVLVLAEGTALSPGTGYPHPTVPRPPAGLAGLPDPVLQLPFGPDDNRRALIWSTEGFPRLVNGRSSTEPRVTGALLADVTGFPDARSVAALRRLGVRTVVLHTDRLAGTPWALAPRRPRAGLGLTVRETDGLLVLGLG